MRGFRIAELNLYIDNGELPTRYSLPACYRDFMLPELAETDRLGIVTGSRESKIVDTLLLKVVNRIPPVEHGQGSPLFYGANWELWLDTHGRYIFVAPQEAPAYRIVIDADFSYGEIIGDFSSPAGAALFPLQNLGIRIFINWLANGGDVVVHASGASIHGKGYFFAGESGAGKSTLISALAEQPGMVVLGEDQVIIRYIHGQFWLFGTPWHTNPSLCSPLGVPLHKGFFLDRNKEARAAALSPLEGVSCLFQTAFIPFYRPAAVERILDRFSLLADQTPFYSLSYVLGTDVLDLILNPR